MASKEPMTKQDSVGKRNHVTLMKS